jgi:uncharacterized protein (TIGR00645 family)
MGNRTAVPYVSTGKTRDTHVMAAKNNAEGRFETLLFASRWLMAPMYLGLVLAIIMMVVIFGNELFRVLPNVLTMTPSSGILVVLTLIDLTLTANLLLIVIFSGYENFVSKFDVDDGGDRPDWMGKVDFSGLKMKLIASIVAISAVHLLKRFMEIGDPNATKPVTDGDLFWLTVVHMSFVASGLMLAAMDWLNEGAGARAGTRPKS